MHGAGSVNFVSQQQQLLRIGKCQGPLVSFRSSKQYSKLEMLFGNNKKQKVETLKKVCERHRKFGHTIISIEKNVIALPDVIAGAAFLDRPMSSRSRFSCWKRAT
jgi:hypothetical protein